MRVGNYSLVVVEGSEREQGYVGLGHGQQYTVRMSSHDHRRCDAEVVIDGKPVGTFRLSAYGSAVLERSPDDNGRFTFYSSGSEDAGRAGEASVGTADKGLIQVKFTPEKVRSYAGVPSVVRTSSFRGGPGGQSMSAFPECHTSRSMAPGGQHTNSTRSTEKTVGGITGLSGHSDQRFTNVGAIDLDEVNAVTISLRLVTRDDGPRPLRPAGAGNAVPPPV